MDFGKADAPTMHATLMALNLSPVQSGDVISFGRGESINVKTGQAQLQPGRTLASLKTAYSTQIIKQTAKKYGWQLKQVGPNKFVTVKR